MRQTVARQAQQQAFADEIAAWAQTLAEMDQQVATQITTAVAPLEGISFTESAATSPAAPQKEHQPAVQMAGYVTVEDWAIVGGGTVVHQFARIGRHSIVGGGTRLAQDVAPYMTVAGSIPRCTGLRTSGAE